MKEQRERRIMILMRVILFIAGAGFGAIAMWQGLGAIKDEQGLGIDFPVYVEPFFYIAAALLLGGLLFLSAKPLRFAFRGFSAFLRKRFKTVKAIDVAGIATGLIVGLGLALAFEFIFRDILRILAIRVFLDILIGLLAAFITAIAVSGWLGGDKNAAKQEGEEPRGKGGYLITEAALKDKKIINLCKLWIEGNIYVLNSTAEDLAAAAEIGETGVAYENFNTLYTSKAVKILEFSGKAKSRNEEYLEAAEDKKLKIIAALSETRLCENKKSVVVLTLEEF